MNQLSATPATSRLLSALAATLVLSLTLSDVHATTIEEKSFDDMSAEADMIFVGTVEDVHSEWVAEEGGPIETLVTFSALEWIRGNAHDELTLRFSGGEMNDIAERLPGMPRFSVGDRIAVFANEGQQASPIVGFNQGAFQIIETSAGSNVVDVYGRSARCKIEPASCPSSLPGALETVPAMGLSEFVDAVRARVNTAH